MKIKTFFLALVIGCGLFSQSSAQQNKVPTRAIFEGFYQTSKANCAYVAAIKAAISVFGVEEVFREIVVDPATGNTKVFLRDRFLPIVVTPVELQAVRDRSGFRKAAQIPVYNEVYEFAILCYAVMAKRMMGTGDTFDSVLKKMEEGADVVEAAKLLGLGQFARRKPYLSATAGQCGLMVGGKNHAAFVCNGNIDLWGKVKRLHFLRFYWRRAVIEAPKDPEVKLVTSLINWKKDTLNSISGIDRDEQTDVLYFVSDTRPNRVYRAGMNFLRDRQGNLRLALAFKDSLVIAGMDNTDEPEAIRIAGGKIYISAERQPDQTGIYSGANSSGAIAVTRMALPEAFSKGTLTKNSGIEAFTLSPDQKQIWMVLERPFTGVEDSMIPLVVASDSSETVYQYPLGPSTNEDRGITEILSCGSQEFLSLEREFDGRVTAKLYHCTFTHDGYILKKELVDFSALPIERVENFEAMTWGPTLPGGGRSLIIVSDDNKNQKQTTDVLVVEVGY